MPLAEGASVKPRMDSGVEAFRQSVRQIVRLTHRQ